MQSIGINLDLKLWGLIVPFGLSIPLVNKKEK